MSTGLLRKVEKKSAEQQAVDNLRHFILSGAVKPGARLTEAALAGQLGISRATTRTSMHRLAAEGILIQIPYTGWQVANLTSRDAWELWTLRANLEGLAARLMAEAMSDKSRIEIHAAMDALRQAAELSDIEAINDRDFALHRLIVERSGHKRLLTQYGMVENQVRLYISSSNNLLGEDYLSILDQHRPLAAALLEGDPAQAQAEAEKHNKTEGQKLVNWLRSIEENENGIDVAGHPPG